MLFATVSWNFFLKFNYDVTICTLIFLFENKKYIFFFLPQTFYTVCNFHTINMQGKIAFQWALIAHLWFCNHAYSVKGAHLTRSDICQWAEDLLSSESSTTVLSVISYSLPVISKMTPAVHVGCRDVKSVFFSRNWTTFKLLLWVDFPLWVKGLKYCINYIWLKFKHFEFYLW